MGKLDTSYDSWDPQTKALVCSSKVSHKEPSAFSRANSSSPTTTSTKLTTTTTTGHALSDFFSQQDSQSQMSSLLGFSSSPSFPATIFSTNKSDRGSFTPKKEEEQEKQEEKKETSGSADNNNFTTSLLSESPKTLLETSRSDGSESNFATDSSSSPDPSSLLSTRNISTASSVMSSEQDLKDDGTIWSAAKLQKEGPPPPQDNASQDPPKEPKTPVEAVSSTPTLRDRLNEKTALIFNTISAVNNSKDKRAAVNEVVADITSHVRSKSINSLSSLAGGFGSWAVPAAVTTSESETTKTESLSEAEGLEILLKKPDDVVSATHLSVATPNESADTSVESDKGNNEDNKEAADDNASYYSDGNLRGVPNPYTGSVEASSESSVADSVRTTVPGTPRRVDVCTKYEKDADTSNVASSISSKAESKDTPQGSYIGTPDTSSIKAPASTWKREADQSFHILTLGLAQLNKDPQLGRTLTVHGLGRLAGAVLSELEQGSNGTQKLSEHEHEQMLVTCLTPLMRGRTFSVQMDPENPRVNSAIIEETGIGEIGVDGDIDQVLTVLKESPARRNSMDTLPNTLVHSSKQSIPQSGKKVRRTSHTYGRSSTPPPVYEPQNFAERFVVTSVRSSCLALKTAAPYGRELISALAAEERKLKIFEKLGTMAVKATRVAFFAAILIAGALKKVLLDSEFGRKIGKSLQGLLLAFVVGLSQSMIIMAAGTNNNDNRRWKGDYYYDGEEYEDCEQYEDESASAEDYEEDKEQDEEEEDTTRVEYQDNEKDSWWTTALKMGNSSGMPILSGYMATLYPERNSGVSSGSTGYSQSNLGQGTMKRRTWSRSQKKKPNVTQLDGSDGVSSGLVTPSSSVMAAAGWTIDQLDKLWATYNAQQAQAQFQQQRQRPPSQFKRANGGAGVKAYGPKRS